MNRKIKMLGEIENAMKANNYVEVRFHLGRAHVLLQNRPLSHLCHQEMGLEGDFRSDDEDLLSFVQKNP